MFGINKLKEQVQLANATTLHLRDVILNGLGKSHNGERSTYEVYGYPERYYFRLGYDAIRREGIASRITTGVARSCWRNGFELVNNLDEKEPLLEGEIKELNRMGLFNTLERADVLNRIGAFSVLLVGIPDGQELDQPLGTVTGDGFKSIYFRPFAYDGVTVSSYNTDEMSPRFGMPEYYQLQVMGRGDTQKTTVLKSVIAHYSRVIHMAENLLDSSIEGVPALEPVYNRILDLDKVLGGSAEAYFRNARGKMAFEIDPAFSSDLMNNPAAKEQFDDAAKRFTNGWQDQIVAVGSKVNSVATAHQSPEHTIAGIMREISGYTGIPMRTLTGEGAGQLAGAEDRLAYNGLINDRQSHTCSAWVYSLLEMLEASGMMTLPEEFDLYWPLDEALNAIDEAAIANQRASTLKLLTEAASTAAGDGVNLESALENFGLQDIEVEEYEEPDIVEAEPDQQLEEMPSAKPANAA